MVDDVRPLTVGIAQMGEDLPSDEGYAPLRYGRLAEDLIARGDSVIRITPTFSHFRKENRHARVEHSDTEGEHVVVQTVGYESSFDAKRARFFAQFVAGTAREFRSRRADLDVILVGLPPPSIVAACRAAVGRKVPIIADVRDLWPEAFAVGREDLMPLATAGGTALSQELRLATAITAVTKPMLEWAPKLDRPRLTIPIGLRPRTLDQSALPDEAAPLQACFLSNHSHGYDFVPVLKAWRAYVEQLDDRSVGEPLLGFIGVEPSGDEAIALAEADETVHFLGRVTPGELPSLLSRFDVGLAPALPGWEHSVGNKVFDYLSAGLFMLHSIAPSDTENMDAGGLSKRCELSLDAWSKTFVSFVPERLNELRADRQDRIDLADHLFGREATSGAFIELIDQLAATKNR